MTAVDRVTPEFAGTAPAVQVTRAWAAMVSLFRALKNRREVYRLGAMTDTELADIGLTRGDLHVAVRTPLGVDPTATLGCLAAARAKTVDRRAASDFANPDLANYGS